MIKAAQGWYHIKVFQAHSNKEIRVIRGHTLYQVYLAEGRGVRTREQSRLLQLHRIGCVHIILLP